MTRGCVTLGLVDFGLRVEGCKVVEEGYGIASNAAATAAATAGANGKLVTVPVAVASGLAIKKDSWPHLTSPQMVSGVGMIAGSGKKMARESGIRAKSTAFRGLPASSEDARPGGGQITHRFLTVVLGFTFDGAAEAQIATANHICTSTL